MRLPNTGTIERRKADNSGNLGIALNPFDHLAVDRVIHFAPGWTFGSTRAIPQVSRTVSAMLTPVRNSQTPSAALLDELHDPGHFPPQPGFRIR